MVKKISMMVMSDESVDDDVGDDGDDDCDDDGRSTSGLMVAVQSEGS